MNYRINDTLSRRKCVLVEHDTHNICKRIKDIDKDYFIVRNVITGKYEVHNTSNIGNTFCFAVPYEKLDARTLKYCRETSTARNIVAVIEQHNAKIDKAIKRSRRNDFESRTMEFADRIAYALDEDAMHDGYKKTHLIKGA